MFLAGQCKKMRAAQVARAERGKRGPGPAETRTRIVGFRVQSADHYTTGPLGAHPNGGGFSLTGAEG